MSKIKERREASMAKPKKVRLRGKNQVTIPSDLIEELHLEPGEDLEVMIENGHLVLVPVITIEKDQSWFWTESWQAEEREAQKDIQAGQTRTFEDVDSLLADLDDDEDELDE